MLNGKTSIIGIIQSLVNIPTTATCALLLHFTINKILLSRRRIVMTRARSKNLLSLEMSVPACWVIQLFQRHKELLSKPQSNKLCLISRYHTKHLLRTRGKYENKATLLLQLLNTRTGFLKWSSSTGTTSKGLH